MEAITKQILDFSRQDDENLLAKKIYKNVSSASKIQIDETIKESELSNIRIEDDAEKIIDNLITLYEGKINSVVIQNVNFLRYIGTRQSFLLDLEQVKLIRDTATYNTILISWNALINLLNNAKKNLSVSYQNLRLRLKDLNTIISQFLEISLEFFNNLSQLDRKPNAQTNPLLVQLMKLYSISNLIRNQIVSEKYIRITFNDIGLEYEALKIDPLINEHSRNRLKLAERLFRGEKGLIRPIKPSPKLPEPDLTIDTSKEVVAQSSKGKQYDTKVEELNRLQEQQLKKKDKRREKKIEKLKKKIANIEKTPAKPIEEYFEETPFTALQTEEDDIIDEMGAALMP